MAHIILVTGGSRSGKSTYARQTAENIPGAGEASSPAHLLFVATCPVVDDEMRQRIHKHQESRQGRWDTIEESTGLAAVLNGAEDYEVVLVDCLTLWLNNLMREVEEEGRELSEEEIEPKAHELLAACASRSGTVIFVTNEVGMGIVPENPLARRYRDLVGRCNQVLAAGADEVIFVACGIPINLK